MICVQEGRSGNYIRRRRGGGVICVKKGVNWDYVQEPSVVRIMISVKGVQAIQA